MRRGLSVCVCRKLDVIEWGPLLLPGLLMSHVSRRWWDTTPESMVMLLKNKLFWRNGALHGRDSRIQSSIQLFLSLIHPNPKCWTYINVLVLFQYNGLTAYVSMRHHRWSVYLLFHFLWWPATIKYWSAKFVPGFHKQWRNFLWLVNKNWLLSKRLQQLQLRENMVNYKMVNKLIRIITRKFSTITNMNQERRAQL